MLDTSCGSSVKCVLSDEDATAYDQRDERSNPLHMVTAEDQLHDSFPDMGAMASAQHMTSQFDVLPAVVVLSAIVVPVPDCGV